MIHVNTFLDGEIIAAYTAPDEEVPPGIPVGRQGNAVLIMDGGVHHVISRPLIDGDILDVVPAAAGVLEMDLSKYFTRTRTRVESPRRVRISMRNFV